MGIPFWPLKNIVNNTVVLRWCLTCPPKTTNYLKLLNQFHPDQDHPTHKVHSSRWYHAIRITYEGEREGLNPNPKPLFLISLSQAVHKAAFEHDFCFYTHWNPLSHLLSRHSTGIRPGPCVSMSGRAGRGKNWEGADRGYLGDRKLKWGYGNDNWGVSEL